MMGLSPGTGGTNDALSVLAALGDPKKADATLREWKAEADRAEKAREEANAANAKASADRDAAERALALANRVSSDTLQSLQAKETDLRAREGQLAANSKALDDRVAVHVSAEALTAQMRIRLNNAQQQEAEAASKNAKAQETLNQAEQIKAAYQVKLAKLKQIVD